MKEGPVKKLLNLLLHLLFITDVYDIPTTNITRDPQLLKISYYLCSLSCQGKLECWPNAAVQLIFHNPDFPFSRVTHFFICLRCVLFETYLQSFLEKGKQ